MWAEKNTKAIMSVKSTGAEEFIEFTVCPAYEHAYSSSGLAVRQWSIVSTFYKRRSIRAGLALYQDFTKNKESDKNDN